jgi:hypothetical protein
MARWSSSGSVRSPRTAIDPRPLRPRGRVARRRNCASRHDSHIVTVRRLAGFPRVEVGPVAGEHHAGDSPLGSGRSKSEAPFASSRLNRHRGVGAGWSGVAQSLDAGVGRVDDGFSASRIEVSVVATLVESGVRMQLRSGCNVVVGRPHCGGHDSFVGHDNGRYLDGGNDDAKSFCPVDLRFVRSPGPNARVGRRSASIPPGVGPREFERDTSFAPRLGGRGRR